MTKEHLYLGQSGEEAAVSFIKRNGYRIITKNYKSKLGEIDIIARDKGTICFIEVKSRKTDRYGLPQEAVSMDKQRHISRAALLFLKEKNLLNKKARFDVISIIYNEGIPKLGLIKNAFELDARFTP